MLVAITNGRAGRTGRVGMNSDGTEHGEREGEDKQCFSHERSLTRSRIPRNRFYEFVRILENENNML
jgi:hypothetical protein